MSDDTIRTRAINYTRTNWSKVLAWVIAGVSTAISTVATVSMGLAHRQDDGQTLVNNVAVLTTKVDSLTTKVNDIALTQAEMKGTLTVVKDQVQPLVKFKDDTSQGIKDALATPVPKFNIGGHRAKHQ